MLNEREFMIAMYASLKEIVDGYYNKRSNRLTKSVIAYTEPVRLASGNYVTCFAYREEGNGSGNGGILKLPTVADIEARFQNGRRNSVEAYMVKTSEIDSIIDENYNIGTGQNIPQNNFGHKGANLYKTVAELVDNLEDALLDLVDILAEIAPQTNIVMYMKSSAVMSQDLIDELDGCYKQNNALVSPSGIAIKPTKVTSNGEVSGILTITGDIRKATKDDII